MSSHEALSLRERHPDLQKILHDLRSSVGNTVTSLYDLQDATIQKHGFDPCKGEVEVLRDDLKTQWQNIIAFVKSSCGFSEDINYLRNFVSSRSKGSLQAAVDDLVSQCKDLVTNSQSLSRGFRVMDSPYDRYWTSTMRPQSPSSDALKDTTCRPDFKNVVEQVEVSRNYHLDGDKALVDFYTAQRGIQVSLQTFATFWNNLYQPLALMSGKTISIGDEAIRLTDSWSNSEEEIMQTVIQLIGFCDAVEVSAVPRSTSRSQSRKTGSIMPWVISLGVVAFSGMASNLSAVAKDGLSRCKKSGHELGGRWVDETGASNPHTSRTRKPSPLDPFTDPPSSHGIPFPADMAGGPQCSVELIQPESVSTHETHSPINGLN